MHTTDELRPVKEAQEADFLNLPGVTGVDIGPKYVGGEKTEELAIRVFVEEKKDTAKVPASQRIPKTVKNIKTDVIEAKFVLHPLMMRVQDIVLMKDTGKYDPLQGGISIGPCRSVYLDATNAACHGATAAGYYYFTGTLGAIVIDNVTKAKMLLSNFHVMCVDNNWHVGDQMVQPSVPDGGVCPTDVVGTLQRAALTASVDAAVCSQTARGYKCAIVDIGNVMGTAAATVGMAVRKRGRTTGLTYGTVESLDLSVNINYCNGLGLKTLTKQISIKVDAAKSPQFGAGGDSGSVVVDSTGKVVGLYFAGDTTGAMGVANPIAAVLSALNVSMCGVIKKYEPDHPIKKLEPDHPIKKNEYEIKKSEYDIKKIEKEHEIKKQESEPIKGLNEPIYGKGMAEPIYGKGASEPVMPGIGGQQPPVTSPIEERLARVEAALAQLSHFITPESRPETEKAPLQNEAEFSG